METSPACLLIFFMKNEVTLVNRKTFKIRESGRSTDFISPSFGHGCLYNCSYCYMKRHKFKDLDSLNFYKSRSKIMNHLRNPSKEISVDGKIVKSPYKNDNEFINYAIKILNDNDTYLRLKENLLKLRGSKTYDQVSKNLLDILNKND